MKHLRSTRAATIAVTALASALALTACTADGPGDDDSNAAPSGETVTLSLATSQPENTPNFYCGAELLKERVEAADVGVKIDLFPSSQLGPDTERFPAIQSGDIDIDLQGASGLSQTFAPIGVLDAAYAFESVDHVFDWIDNNSQEMFDAFNEETGTTIVDGWYFGTRTFSSTAPIRNPDELAALQIRFPDSPAFLANAKAMGANPVAVASEEVYVALQQGIAQGQENPVVATKSQSYDEVLKYVNLNNHQIGIHWIVVSDKTFERLNDEQEKVLVDAIHEIRAENRECVDEETNTILDEWRANGPLTVIEEDEIDKAAFIAKAEEFFSSYFTGDDLALYEQIRSTAP
ncbi:TRAP transporter substrate-binding protein DctP [Ruicaihuangia caeni]|uniref:TRAP transporter substrate-binding protein DctP n=1 Tax=Ruicaihuangia caeni TaxID=3042517 RepID=UPI00338D87D3